MAMFSRWCLAVMGACLLTLGEVPPTPADNRDDEIIDTHTHFYDPSRPEGVPWPTKNDKLLYRTVLPRDFLRVARPVGVKRTIVVEASPWVEDNQWLLDLAAKDGTIVGVVGRLFPGEKNFAAHVKRFAKNPRFRGIRILKDELEKGLTRPEYLDDLKLLDKLGLTLDVNGGPDMPAVVARLARQLPSLRIVINHAANLRIDAKAVPDNWLKGMKQAAANKNVYCKVSALVEGAVAKNGKAPVDLAYYRPVLDSLGETFGPERLIYGSNWPVSESRADYATVFSIAQGFVRTKDSTFSKKFWTTNARKAYQLP